jgi:hypothetical protein
MAKTSKQILERFAKRLVKDMQKAIPSATGKTADSIREESTDTGFTIFGGQQIFALVDGRKPTSAGATAGNPTLQEEIFKWIKAKSISPKDSSMSKLSLSWAISKSIHEKGYKGNKNLFKSVLYPKRFNSLTSLLAESQSLIIQTQISNQFKK